MKNKSLLAASFLAVLLLSATVLVSGCGGNDTAVDTKYLSNFHEQYFGANVDPLEKDNLTLYVDYSKCMVLAKDSDFFNALTPSFVDATKTYFSIEGKNIVEHDADSTYTLLRTITETNYADLKTVAEKMAESKSESVLLTDGEYYQPNAAKGGIVNPYLAPALKKWLLRGHDVYMISEPYKEEHNGNTYNKKRFYILFTDNRLPGNIYNRIVQSSKLEDFPECEVFHLSADHPSLYGNENMSHSTLNPSLTSLTKGFGSYEIQDWQITWKDAIEPMIVYAVDPQTGAPLPNGDYITKGIKVDRNSLGAFRIESVSTKVYNINTPYFDYYNEREAKVKPTFEKSTIGSYDIGNFIMIDTVEFKNHGDVALYFDPMSYAPKDLLKGSPFNYLKVDICVDNVKPIFSQYEDKFKFESIDRPGQINESVAASIKQCMTDPDIQTMVTKAPIYSIYIKSFEY